MTRQYLQNEYQLANRTKVGEQERIRMGKTTLHSWDKPHLPIMYYYWYIYTFIKYSILYWIAFAKVLKVSFMYVHEGYWPEVSSL